MADHPSYPRTQDAAEPGNERASGRPSWQGIAVGVIVIALFLAIVILHLTGVFGPGMNG